MVEGLDLIQIADTSQVNGRPQMGLEWLDLQLQDHNSKSPSCTSQHSNQSGPFEMLLEESKNQLPLAFVHFSSIKMKTSLALSLLAHHPPWNHSH